MKRRFCVITLLVVTFIMSITTVAAAVDKPIKWRVVTHQPTGTVRYELVANFCKSVTEASGGRLVLEPYGAGMLFPAGETFDAVKLGTVQMASASSGFWGGKNLAFAYHGGRPGGPITKFEEGVYLYEQTAEFAKKLYSKYGITYIGPSQFAPPEQLIGVVPVKTLKDLKGKRIRSQGTSANFYGRLGASVITSAPSEVYTALQTKQVDLAEYNDYAVNMQLNLQEAAKFVMPGLHYDSIEEQSLIANPRAWNSLPEDLKRIVNLAREEMLCKSAIDNGIGTIFAKRKWEENKEITFIEFSEEDVKQARTVAHELMLEDAQKNPDIAEYVKIYAKVLYDLGYYEDAKFLGYK